MVLSPCDWKVSRTTVLVPDLIVVRQYDLDLDQPFTGSPLLVVIEVRSPPTAATDRTLKRRQYEQHGAAAYWLVDPGGPVTSGLDPAGLATGRVTGDGAATRVPSPTAFRLRDGVVRRGGVGHWRRTVRGGLPVPGHHRARPPRRIGAIDHEVLTPRTARH